MCMKEVNFLRKRDAAAGRIDFVDIALPSYMPEENAGITFREVGRLATAAAAAADLTMQECSTADVYHTLLKPLSSPPVPCCPQPTHTHTKPHAGHGAHPRHPARRHHRP